MAKKAREVKIVVARDEHNRKFCTIVVSDKKGKVDYGRFYSQYVFLRAVERLEEEIIITRKEKEGLEKKIKSSKLRKSVAPEELFDQLEYLTDLVMDLFRTKDGYREDEYADEYTRLSWHDFWHRYFRRDELFYSSPARAQRRVVEIDLDMEDY